MTRKIIVASTNKGKIKEVKDILNTLQGLQFTVESLNDYDIPEPDEPYDSFMENAMHKAKYYAQHTRQPALSDDSGLCIQSLNGFPGVKTKDFLEEWGSLPTAFSKLENMLQGIDQPKAYFNCAMVLYKPDKDELITSEARIKGTLTFPHKGEEGFGFDPIFIPEGYDQTLAQLGDKFKNQISHRSQALRGLVEKLKNSFNLG